MPSAYYGTNDTAELAKMSALPGIVKGRTPIFLNYAELDPPDFKPQADLLNDAMCKAGHCPTYIGALPGATHISSTFAVGTPDESLSGPVLKFIRGVK